jgi:two-component system, LuxR family, sensor kinase FixL
VHLNIKATELLNLYSEANRRRFLITALCLVGVIAITDWLVFPTTTIGFLYIFPILLASGFLTRGEILLLCVGCAVLRELSSPAAKGLESIPRIGLVAMVFSGAGLFVRELVRNRQIVLGNLRELEAQVKLRELAEKQLQVLIDSTPAAILIADGHGKILSANAAAGQMLEMEDHALEGEQIDSYLPVLSTVRRNLVSPEYFRIDIESTGSRRSGEIFLAHMWISSYNVGSQRRLAVIAVDTSEELRDRAESSLHRTLSNSRILMGAVSHEIRNLCGAIGVVHANLERVPLLQENEDFRALGSLTEGLRKVAAAQLRPFSEYKMAAIRLQAVLDDLRIVIEPSFRESEATISWNMAATLPQIWADHQALLQVFLNLSQNSLRALQHAASKVLTITGCLENERVIVRFHNAGSALKDPERLFQPFQEGAEGSGLGLYVSRANIRAFGGDLRYEANYDGACFALELIPADEEGNP